MSSTSENSTLFADETEPLLQGDTEPSTSRSTQYSFTPTPENSKSSTKPDLKNSSNLNDNDDEKRDDSMYVCNICLDIAKDAVVSMCGHLYCWCCLNTWLETRPHRQLCPVCKAAISKEKVIPLYGRNSENQQDPRNKTTPPRPQAQRTEPEASQGFQGFPPFGGDGSFHLSFGIGAFPFGFFASSFNFNNDMRPRNAQQAGLNEEDQFLSKLFLYVAMIFFFWLILA